MTTAEQGTPEEPPRPRGRRLRTLDELPTTTLKGIGPQKAGALRTMGLGSVLDLLMHYPLRYVDRSHRADVESAVVGEEAMFVGTLRSVTTRRPRGGGRTMVEAVLVDGAATLLCTFFNQAWRASQLQEGMVVAVFGTVGEFRGRRQLVNPVLDVIGPASPSNGGERRTGKVVPVYPQSGKAGIGSPEIGRYLEEVLERAGDFADPLPEGILRQLDLTDRTTAFNHVHAPPEYGDDKPARKRLKFDELFRLQLELVMRKRAAEAASRGIEHAVGDVGDGEGLVRRFLEGLPFALTGAQARAVAEIAGDLGSPLPMHRLLQGDVGAGKTVVALATLLYAVQGGYQGALMVPTEVLAEQHFFAAERLLRGLTVPDERRLGGERPLGVALLTARTPGGERARLRTDLAEGVTDLVVGTHALLTEDVRFRALGVAVIDEQHRFGVEQRSALREKAAGHDPDVLVMTATPIPRTAAMTVYGDLDLTVLDELPAGRAPVRTRWLRTPGEDAKAWARVREQAGKGRQAYVVCPLVGAGSAPDDGAAGGPTEEEGEGEGRRPPRSAEEEHRRLTAAGGELEGLRVGLLHGQLPPREKEATMGAFRAGELDVLVATTVVEVGVDVTDATVMVVEDADRFGIAQLHQLRGRVGRGSDPSWCYLLADAAEVTPDAERRLQALERTTDGFELAEVDLDLRGEGTVLGTRQQGRNELKLASIRHDRDLVLAARRVAGEIVDEDPDLSGHPLLADELRLFIDEEAAAFLFKS